MNMPLSNRLPELPTPMGAAVAAGLILGSGCRAKDADVDSGNVPADVPCLEVYEGQEFDPGITTLLKAWFERADSGRGSLSLSDGFGNTIQVAGDACSIQYDLVEDSGLDYAGVLVRGDSEALLTYFEDGGIFVNPTWRLADDPNPYNLFERWPADVLTEGCGEIQGDGLNLGDCATNAL